MTLVDVVYVNQDGSQQTVTVPEGTTVMHAAVSNSVDGIVAECGGAMMCATCHVYVPDEWLNRLPSISDGEDATLDSTVADRRSNSRLSCQLRLTASLNGLIVHLPKTQI